MRDDVILNGFTEFPSIESFAHVHKYLTRGAWPPRIRFGAKIKLQGTNAGVRVSPDGEVAAQSRSRDITPEEDNAGFAAWVQASEEAWRSAARTPLGAVFFGEWAGKGIQKGDAVCQLDRKYFFVFAIQHADDVIVDPETIERLIPDLDDVLVLPWMEVYEELDFDDRAACVAFAERVSAKAEEIGERDPFIAEVFGVEGPGEGIVVFPHSRTSQLRDDWASKTFKAKAEAHRVKKSKSAAGVKLEVPEGVTEFVESFVTDARCEQAVSEACEGVVEKRRTGDFMKWIGNDIRKESIDELEAMGLEWKRVAGFVNKAAQRWFLTRAEVV